MASSNRYVDCGMMLHKRNERAQWKVAYSSDKLCEGHVPQRSENPSSTCGAHTETRRLFRYLSAGLQYVHARVVTRFRHHDDAIPLAIGVRTLDTATAKRCSANTCTTDFSVSSQTLGGQGTRQGSGTELPAPQGCIAANARFGMRPKLLMIAWLTRGLQEIICHSNIINPLTPRRSKSNQCQRHYRMA